MARTSSSANRTMSADAAAEIDNFKSTKVFSRIASNVNYPAAIKAVEVLDRRRSSSAMTALAIEAETFSELRKVMWDGL